MKHALRKYISSCGSALFMVVSTMAALIVLVTAMYMSVLSSRQVQYATFDQEQAYVTSSSISDMVYTYIFSSGGTSLRNAIGTLKVGESVSTNGNDYISFGGSSKDDDLRLGAYDVSITYVYNNAQGAVYDIAVTVENNGVFDTTHDFMIISGEEVKMRRIDNFFTSTGYLPTDIWLKKVASDSTMYFDNEFVKFTKHNMGGSVSEDMYFNFDIVALGSVEFGIINNIPADCMPNTPLTWVIGKDMSIPYSNYTQNWTNIDMAGKSANPGRIIVGGDMSIMGNNGKTIAANTEVYVMGDLTLGFQNNNLNILGKIYVGGNIIDTSNSAMSSASLANLYSKTGKYCYKDSEPVSLSSWDDTEAQAIYKEKMNPSVWPKWTVTTSSDKVNIHFNDSNNYTAFIDKDCTIGSYTAEQWSKDRVIIIDTGKNETDVRTIKLTANKEGVPVFSWDPWGHGGTTMVLTVGKGSLVIDVPDDVVYQDCTRELFGNIAWYTLLGGRISYADGKYQFTNRDDVLSHVKAYMLNEYKEGYVLGASDVKLNDGSTRCNGSLSTDPELNRTANIANGACEYVEMTATVGDSSEVRKYYTCTKHGGWYDYDDEACTECAEIDEYYAGNCDSLCVGRINTKAFDNFYKTTNGAQAKASLTNFYSNYDKYVGEDVDDYIYPNVNIFLVSSSENAQINLGKSDYMNDNVQSAYFGYIYAPYMTFAIDGGAGDRNDTQWPLRSIGGLVVSDLIVGSGTGFVFAQPDVSIPGLVGSDWRNNLLESFADKSWRVTFGGT